MLYHNYHRHSHFSNTRTPDSIIKPQHYIDRIKELGHTHFFTTEHGCSSNLYEAYDLCKENDLTCVYGMELYYTDDNDREEKERKSYHIVVIALNNNGRKNLNRISSIANTKGFYYRPRVDMKCLLSLPPKDVIVTTACINNRVYMAEDGNTRKAVDEFLLPLHEHFGDNFFLEVQNHNQEAQIRWNRAILKLSDMYGIGIIHGNDSHYIYPEDAIDRVEYLAGKGMSYGDEDTFILDYPDSDTIYDRYEEQGVLSKKQVDKAMKNTFVFERAEDLGLTKEVKMPTIYPELTPDERYVKLCRIVNEKWEVEKKNIPVQRHKEYVEAIKFELNIIKETNSVNMADYFLMNEQIIKKGIENGGVLSRTGRGSAVSFYINKLLGFTEVDRMKSEVPLYPTRFISTSRVLETRSMADIDFNSADPQPFIDASVEVLGKDNVYYMVAYGTMKDSGAFRNLCRARGLEPNEYNHVGKDLEAYRSDPKWSKLIEDSEKFIGVIDSIAPSPCSFLMLNEPISEEIGLTRVGNITCAAIDGLTSDRWKFLKNDILTVTVWDIIGKVYERIDKPIPNIEELKQELDEDVWNLYRDKITSTMNQVDGDWATNLVGKYEPRDVGELTAFVAGIRPSFSSLLNNFLERLPYSTGTPELDELLESSFHYLLYQENIMQYLTWLGIEEDQTYGLIKRISKKSLGESELKDLEKVLHENWIKQIGDDERFQETWQVIQDSARYGFNASHAYCVALDSLYGANAKAKYPLDYYAVVLEVYQGSASKTASILSELDYFGITLEDIEYGKSKAEYGVDYETNTVYKGMESIKYMNEETSNNLYNLSQNTKHDNFIDLLDDITTQKLASNRRISILIGLNFFHKFGGNDKLEKIHEVFSKFGTRKQLNISKLDELGIDEEILQKYSGRTTEKMYVELDMMGYAREVTESIADKPFSAKKQIAHDLEFLEYTTYINEDVGGDFYAIINYKVFKDKSKPYVMLRQIKTGKEFKSKVTAGKRFERRPFKLCDIIRVDRFREQSKRKLVDGEWIASEETEKVLTEWEVF